MENFRNVTFTNDKVFNLIFENHNNTFKVSLTKISGNINTTNFNDLKTITSDKNINNSLN